MSVWVKNLHSCIILTLLLPALYVAAAGWKSIYGQNFLRHVKHGCEWSSLRNSFRLMETAFYSEQHGISDVDKNWNLMLSLVTLKRESPTSVRCQKPKAVMLTFLFTVYLFIVCFVCLLKLKEQWFTNVLNRYLVAPIWMRIKRDRID